MRTFPRRRLHAPVRLTLAAAPGSVRQARIAVSHALVGRMPSRRIEDVRLLSSELVGNSVRHAGLGPEGALRLSISPTPSGIRVEVTDPGVGFDGGRPRRRTGRESGYGLYLVDRIADRWDVEHEGGLTTVWFELDLRPDGAGTLRGRLTPVAAAATLVLGVLGVGSPAAIRPPSAGPSPVATRVSERSQERILHSIATGGIESSSAGHSVRGHRAPSDLLAILRGLPGRAPVRPPASGPGVLGRRPPAVPGSTATSSVAPTSPQRAR